MTDAATTFLESIVALVVAEHTEQMRDSIAKCEESARLAAVLLTSLHADAQFPCSKLAHKFPPSVKMVGNDVSVEWKTGTRFTHSVSFLATPRTIVVQEVDGQPIPKEKATFSWEKVLVCAEFIMDNVTMPHEKPDAPAQPSV
jgi:sulfur carrier protein ThiS